ncbi:tRNA (adenosine(37)-N6)-threonylcarbamoyltransferase complex ATPase subunit type 1 TsaE [Aliishimia ponticola]|uniref:tRNA threonylcarbamoyladenosine biosynthesis protein TsaE n=1 Tax=Aliishimia ponticola TaxID=2499833 RepID=A0A4S4N8F9_9RHOB|nr:tRNA (adenosine(37)-N6)-threonylcarbamoyltransferase complex ATPase subunit type 1 TsaE [Aliishimia ponticola]THH34627.1 tRNA (adenosine(37)-N6)-threonylcarbamoyltransferase complex ATPase subunit type 1 TsaE [Aliishimia ponticola]
MCSDLFDIVLSTPDATANLAQQIGSRLHVGDTLLLTGDIGAGKTHFARALIQSLQDHPEDVPSPTFTLVQTYDTRKGEVWHADLYRLSGPDEIIELGLLDAFDTAICLVEWPDRLGDDAPPSALHLNFTQMDVPDTRRIKASGARDKWADKLEGITHD